MCLRVLKRLQGFPKLGFSTPDLSLGLSLGLLLAGLLVSGCRSEPNDGSQQQLTRGELEGYNVWLLSVDTLRADRIGTYGYEQRNTTPNLDQLLARGVVFSDASAPRALTWPSLASVITGLFPSHHGLIQNGYELRQGQVTLSTVLQDVGYETAAFLSNMCQANHQAWDVYSCTGGSDEPINREAVDWAEAREPERPFFLWTHFFGPHGPYYNGGDLAERLDPGYDGPVAAKKGVLNRIMSERLELSERDLRHLDALYDAAVIGTDERIGRLMTELGARLDLDRTLIVFLADHGEELYDHNGYIYHACSPYESTLHVPLAFVAPGMIPEGTAVAPVELVDVLPTIFDLLGIESVPADGRILTEFLARPTLEDADHPVISEYHYGETPLHTLKLGREKLVLNPAGVTPDCIPSGPPDLYEIEPVELYDLAADPGEQNNLAAERGERVKELIDRLEDRRRELGLGDSVIENQEIDEDLKRQLEELGYVVQ